MAESPPRPNKLTRASRHTRVVIYLRADGRLMRGSLPDNSFRQDRKNIVAVKGAVHSYKRLAGEVLSLVFFAAETATILMLLFFGSVSVVAPFGRSSRYLNRLQ